MSYEAPVADMMLALVTSGRLTDAIAAGELGELNVETVEDILTEAGRFAAEVLAPLNTVGDNTPPRLTEAGVVTTPAWREAYKAWCAAGWSQLPGPVAYGGQGLPHRVAMAVSELWQGSNLSFGLGPLLTHGAIDAIAHAANDDLKARYLPNMIAGRWMGTMNLTEPQAGTDLGAIRCKAEPAGDGTYRLKGTKIYITYGEHDLADNIIHLVLARLPDAAPGTRGISMFLVPRFLVEADGQLGRRNDVRAVGLEHKLGIHGSPTCVISHGERDGAVGWLIGEAGKGLNAMFVMMNRARLAVAVQGVAVAERATQAAITYAKQRKQGRTAATPTGEMAPIIAHPDVRHMLMQMRAGTAAARALCYAAAAALDDSEHLANADARAAAADRIALLTPIAKAYSTDMAVRVASLGVQVHGGSGFIEGTGAAQHYRDARILPIYEGTNGVQALDLVTRKLSLGDGAAMRALLADLASATARIAADRPDAVRLTQHVSAAQAALGSAGQWMAKMLATDPERALTAATQFQTLAGVTIAGTLLAAGTRGKPDTPAALRAWQSAIFFADSEVALVPAAAAAMQGAGALPDVAAFDLA